MFIVKALSSILVGSIGILSFSPQNYWPCSIFSFMGLQIISNGLSHYKSGIIGFLWGVGFFGTGIYWIYISIHSVNILSFSNNVLLTIILIVYLSSYPALFCICLNYIYKNVSLIKFLILSPSLWHVIEYFRENILTGFPWLELGYSQIDGPLKSIAPILGIKGITFILIIIANLFSLSILYRKYSYCIYAFIILMFSYALSTISWYSENNLRNINIALIQTNTPETLNWNIKNTFNVLNIYSKLIKKISKKNTIIILPESAIPNSLLNEKNILNTFKNILKRKNASLVIGYIKSYYNKHKQISFCNAIAVLQKNKNNIYNYQIEYKKHHLVPFSENIPYKKIKKILSYIFNFAILPFESGPYIQSPIKIKNFYFSASICYEIIFGKQILDNFYPNVDFLLSLANDVWFKNSSEPWQHFQMARMRALELGRPLIHSSNNGITAIINANGTINTILPQFKKLILEKNIKSTSGVTPYAKFGLIPIWTITIICIIYSINKLKIMTSKKNEKRIYS
ncbi:apolipoprotein N-acyltransferase [Buchnera aphidicola]|nr:apolipoprotein N-acyltransferase [Buchnera aphidicola]